MTTKTKTKAIVESNLEINQSLIGDNVYGNKPATNKYSFAIENQHATESKSLSKLYFIHVSHKQVLHKHIYGK